MNAYQEYLKNKEYLEELYLFDDIENYLIDEVGIDDQMLDCMLDYVGRRLDVFKHIYETITLGNDFDEIVERLKNERQKN